MLRNDTLYIIDNDGIMVFVRTTDGVGCHLSDSFSEAVSLGPVEHVMGFDSRSEFENYRKN